jgi:hypothetical protein
MTGVAGAATFMLAGILAWNAQATPLTGTGTLRATYSLVERAACGGWGVCRPGRTLVCRPLGGCWCARCGYRWRY